MQFGETIDDLQQIISVIYEEGINGYLEKKANIILTNALN